MAGQRLDQQVGFEGLWVRKSQSSCNGINAAIYNSPQMVEGSWAQTWHCPHARGLEMAVSPSQQTEKQQLAPSREGAVWWPQGVERSFSPIQANTLLPCTSASAGRKVCALEQPCSVKCKNPDRHKKSTLKKDKIRLYLSYPSPGCAGDLLCQERGSCSGIPAAMQLRHGISRTLYWEHSHALQMVMGFFSI